MFEIGDKAVCIKDLSPYAYKGEQCPKVGKIYTVRALVPEVNSIRIEEVFNTPRLYADGFKECGFEVVAFRKLDYQLAEDCEQMVNEEYLEEVAV